MVVSFQSGGTLAVLRWSYHGPYDSQGDHEVPHSRNALDVFPKLGVPR